MSAFSIPLGASASVRGIVSEIEVKGGNNFFGLMGIDRRFAASYLRKMLLQREWLRSFCRLHIRCFLKMLIADLVCFFIDLSVFAVQLINCFLVE